MPRMASEHASDGKTRRSKQTVTLEGQPVVFRAARLEPACGRQQGPYEQLIPTNRCHQNTCDGHHGRDSFAVFSRSAVRLSVPSVRRMSSSRSANRRVITPGRPTNITATFARNALCSRRYASRRRRRPRFRITALPMRRLTAKPTRRPLSNGRHNTTKLGLSSRLPCRKSAWISEARRSRSLRCRESLPEGIVFLPLNGESLPSFCPTPLQHVPSALRFHPLAEAVRLGATPSVRLKGPLHGEISPSGT